MVTIMYVCDKKKKCKDSITCGGDYCNHTLSEEHALYPEHGKFRIFGDTGNGFVLEEIEND